MADHIAEVTRRDLLAAAAGMAGAAVVAAPAGALPKMSPATAPDAEAALKFAQDAIDLVKKLTGKTPIESGRVRLVMPHEFSTGYTVPLSLQVDSPMTTADHVKQVRVIAPRNPIVEIIDLHFVAGRSVPRVATRVRLAEPQYVVAVAEMSDGKLLMAKSWVSVATDGCK